MNPYAPGYPSPAPYPNPSLNPYSVYGAPLGQSLPPPTSVGPPFGYPQVSTTPSKPPLDSSTASSSSSSSSLDMSLLLRFTSSVSALRLVLCIQRWYRGHKGRKVAAFRTAIKDVADERIIGEVVEREIVDSLLDLLANPPADLHFPDVEKVRDAEMVVSLLLEETVRDMARDVVRDTNSELVSQFLARSKSNAVLALMNKNDGKPSLQPDPSSSSTSSSAAALNTVFGHTLPLAHELMNEVLEEVVLEESKPIISTVVREMADQARQTMAVLSLLDELLVPFIEEVACDAMTDAMVSRVSSDFLDSMVSSLTYEVVTEVRKESGDEEVSRAAETVAMRMIASHLLFQVSTRGQLAVFDQEASSVLDRILTEVLLLRHFSLSPSTPLPIDDVIKELAVETTVASLVHALEKESLSSGDREATVKHMR
eukprot:GILI01022810.1.p1 GENE.GILI01022810.1~~GILI01022810.1.p1  ORF type:complete len:427 (+),score=82.31 GILI01022810.1:116-1396(+)